MSSFTVLVLVVNFCNFCSLNFILHRSQPRVVHQPYMAHMLYGEKTTDHCEVDISFSSLAADLNFKNTSVPSEISDEVINTMQFSNIQTLEQPQLDRRTENCERSTGNCERSAEKGERSTEKGEWSTGKWDFRKKKNYTLLLSDMLTTNANYLGV